MPDVLRQRPFSTDNLAEVTGFNCGDEPWERAQSEWIREHAFASINQRGTEVFLYYNQSDELVAFGSLGKTRRRYPPPDGSYQNLSIIPSLAIQSRFQGRPSDGPKYSNQIMEDLIAKSQSHGTNILILEVHEENMRAIQFYQNFGFTPLGDIHQYHIKMFLRIS